MGSQAPCLQRTDFCEQKKQLLADELNNSYVIRTGIINGARQIGIPVCIALVINDKCTAKIIQ